MLIFFVFRHKIVFKFWVSVVLVIGLVARLGISKNNVNITTNDTVSNHTSLLQHKTA